MKDGLTSTVGSSGFDLETLKVVRRRKREIELEEAKLEMRLTELRLEKQQTRIRSLEGEI